VATDILQRMNELAVQAQGATGTANISLIQVEFSGLNAQLSLLGAQGVSDSLAGLTGATAATSIAGILTSVAKLRAGYGATIAQAEFNVQTFEVNRENTAAALSRIMDADFAAETANLTRGQILQQAGTAMVAQANQIPNGVLALLR
jgi:flagellin